MSVRRLFVSCLVLFLLASDASAARYQRTKDGKTIVWNNLRGVAQEVTWSGLRDLNGYATGEGTLTWYRLGSVVNSYTGKMVRGKFEGAVVREQGTTRLQATFANGERVGPWLEPGSKASPVPTPTPNGQPARPVKEEPIEAPVIESPSPSPEILPTALPTLPPTPILRPTPKPTPSPIWTTTPKPIPTATPTPTSTLTPTPTSTATPTSTSTSTPTPRPSPTSTPQPSPIEARRNVSPGPIVEGPTHTLELATSAAPRMQTLPEEIPRPAESPTSRITPPTRRVSPPAPTSASPGQADLKRRMIADLKKQTEFVLGQVREATGSFRPVDQLEQVRTLPDRVSAHVALLANQAREFRAVLGYEVTYYECLSEIQAVDSLVLVDEATRDIAAKDLPTARRDLLNLGKRYSEPTAEAQKPMWHYLVSLFALCDRLKIDAERHLDRAHSLESEGKKADALREYREIYRIYPNPVTAEKIRQLGGESP